MEDRTETREDEVSDLTQENNVGGAENGENEAGEKEKDLLCLLKSWDVETYLEQPRERTVCQYFQSSGQCPYLEVGCMFLHEAATPDSEAAGAEADSEGEEERTEAAPTTLRYRERLSARSRNRKVNEDRFRRMRDLSISCP